MGNLHDIKNRIKSVKSTGKITQAMKMVAAANVKKAEHSAKSGRSYSSTLTNMIVQLMKAEPTFNSDGLTFEKSIENYPVLLQNRPIKTVGLLVVTADKGLAGAYNANVIKAAIVQTAKFLKQGLNIKLFLVGLKGITSLTKYYKDRNIENVEIVKTYSKIPPLPTIGVTNVIAEDLANFMVKGEIDNIEIITTMFKSMLSFKVNSFQLLPLILPEDNEAKLAPEMIFEPSAEKVLQKVIPLYIANTIYHVLIEASASELASRMNAMSNATKNAEEMIRTLTIKYNKERQYKITNELIEVVSGAAAIE